MPNTITISFACLIFLGLGGCNSTTMSSPSPPRNILISPSNAVVGSLDLTMTVTGTDFVNADHNHSFVVFSLSGTDNFLATTFVSKTELTTVIPADLLVNPGLAEVLVETGDINDSLPLAKSTPATFSITSNLEAVTISSISPASALSGSPELTITVTGANFVNGDHERSIVVFIANGTIEYLSTHFVSSTQLIAVIPAAFMVSPVSANIQVRTGDLIGSEPLAQSNSIAFSVNSQ